MIVMFRKEGQLGNRLFNFANFIAFAEAECFTLANPSFSEYAHLFSTTRQDLLCRYPPKISFLSRFGAHRVREALYSIVNFIARALKKINAVGLPAVCYLHPWELDPAQPKSADLRLYHYYRLRSAEVKFGRLLRDFRFISTQEWMERNQHG